MTTAFKEYPQTAENIFIGLPVSFSFEYLNEVDRTPIDLRGKNAVMDLRKTRDTSSPLITSASTYNGKIILGVGTIEIINFLTEFESAALVEGTYIADFLLENGASNWQPLIGILFKAQKLSTKVQYV